MNSYLVKVANLRLHAVTLVAALALTACGADVVTASPQAGAGSSTCHGLMCLSGSGSGGSVGNIPSPNTGAFDGSGGSGGVLVGSADHGCNGLMCLSGSSSGGSVGNIPPVNTGAFDGSGGSGGVLRDAHVSDRNGLSCLDGEVGSVGNTGDTTPAN